MKKIVFVFGLLVALQFQVKVSAQSGPDEDVVNFAAILGGVFEVVVTEGGDQTAYFQSGTDYDIGVSETQGIPGIDPGNSIVTMTATSNWLLRIHAEDFQPNGGGATGSIPINNLGVWCEAQGVHQFGVEVTCLYTTDALALGILPTDINLIELNAGNSNSGTSLDNQFKLNWLMGTMQGSMNTQSMFTQLSNGVFTQGTYITTVILTMVEVL